MARAAWHRLADDAGAYSSALRAAMKDAAGVYAIREHDGGAVTSGARA